MLFRTCLAFFAIGTIANAGIIHSATVVGSTLGEFSTPQFQLENLTNQVGLTANYVSGVDDFDTSIAAISHVSTEAGAPGDWASSVSQTPITPGTIDFDLGQELVLGQLAAWNSRVGNAGRHIRDFSVLTDTNSNFSNATNVGSFVNPQNGLDGTIFDLTDSTARFVRIQIDTNHGLNLIQMGEFAFDIGANDVIATVPEPSSFLVAIIGMAAWGIRRRIF